MLQTIIRKYNLNLPRYTSYPTAPHFSTSVRDTIHKKFLEDLAIGSCLSLYLHIVYCADMCWFCGCHTKITHRCKPIKDYIEALLKEIDLVAESLQGKRTVKYIHFGGGSPTILSGRDFAHIITYLRTRFDLLSDTEIAIEIDPRTASADYVAELKYAGITRVSIGVQDFNIIVQKAINRFQPYSITAKAIAWLRAQGITAINIDLMYGLPYQTVSSLLATIDQAMALMPKRLSLFGYAHVPWIKKHQGLFGEEILPNIEERWLQYETAHKRLLLHGYVAIGLDHYAMPDDALSIALKGKELHRNFQGYTTDKATALIGIGASAISSLPYGYTANESNISSYKRIINSRKFATCRGYILTQEDVSRRHIIEHLMCHMSVNLEHLSINSSERKALSELEFDGIITRSGNTISVTSEGRPLVRAVCAVFDHYLKTNNQYKHTQIV